jgi:uncharacterized protein
MRFRRSIPLGILVLSTLSLTSVNVHAASYEPIDCARASTAADTTICKNYALGQDEARLATLFGVLTSLVAMGQRADLADAQRRWISVRKACGSDRQCLSRAYRTRINELSQAMDALAKRGPF